MTAFSPELVDTLTLGAAEVLPAGGLEARLKAAAAEGRPLRVKLGFDPTKPDLHIGHAVVLWALRRFQDAGHQVVLIIGDFTARIGDPTGKQEARPPLTKDEVEANAQTYLDQLGRIIDLSRAEIRRNGEWLEPMAMESVIRLLGQSTVAQMLQRENFALRHERGDAIGLHEFLYPLLQGQDSVVIHADVELGGTDQKFNNLMGRHLQEQAHQAPQVVMLYPILEGIGTTEKMSKSLGNTIGLTDAPKAMWDKVMCIADRQMPDYFTLASGLPAPEIRRLLADLAAGQLPPRDAKVRLARAIVSLYHGPAVAEKLASGSLDTADMPAFAVPDGTPVARLLVALKMANSTSQARERLKEGAVKLLRAEGDHYAVERVLSDPNEAIALGPDGQVVQVGKRMAHAKPDGTTP
ncbi:MAG: tyrosine--tRNA ligase [Candidatus Sericytochromatia bacterium]|nr:tyrosine--tRNA ligase [Candidatus Sericytochromatia bacterium]